MEIGHVENFPAKLQALALHRHLPTLVQRDIQTGEAIAANHVSGASLARIRMDEVGECGGRITENADRTGNRIPVMSELRAGGHLGYALLVPVGRPEVAIVYGEREAAGPAGHARHFPTADDGVGEGAGAAGEAPAFAEGELGDPVGVELVGSIKIRDAVARVRRKSVGQPAARRSHVCAGAVAQPGCVGSKVNRLGIGVVEVEL